MFHISETHSVLLCSHFSSQKPIAHYSLEWNALPYIGKFDGQAAFGIYGLAATCGHNNTNQALQPCCFEHKYNTHTIQCAYGCSTVTASLQLRPSYGCSQSTVTVNLWLRSIYGYGQSTVMANLRLRPIYSYGQSMVTANLQLRPLYFVTTASLPITVLLYLDYMYFQRATLVQ